MLDNFYKERALRSLTHRSTISKMFSAWNEASYRKKGFIKTLDNGRELFDIVAATAGHQKTMDKIWILGIAGAIIANLPALHKH